MQGIYYARRKKYSKYVLNLFPRFRKFELPAGPWQKLPYVASLIIVLSVFLYLRIYTYTSFQHLDYTSTHPMTRVYQEMAVSMKEGHALGEINLDRFSRSKMGKPGEVYPIQAEKGDRYCQFKSLDPGYGAVFYAARELFKFTADNAARPVYLQMFVDLFLVLALYATFYRWGFLPAVAASTLYSLNVIFALASATPWYHFWDGSFFAFSMLGLLWLYRLAKQENPPNNLIAILAVAIGLLLGANVWIRSSWFIFAPMMMGLCLFSKTLRPWLLAIFISFALLAGGMVVRSTTLSGHFAYSTRMSWHTAFQALGRAPNKYGFEDSDLHLQERAKNVYGIDFNLCDYSQQDNAMKTDYMALMKEDPGYVAQSFVQRLFSNIFFNFNHGGNPFWNSGMLALAWLGLLFALWQRGEHAFFISLSAAMYFLINGSYALVYFVQREYAYPTQMLLLFGAIAALSGVIAMAGKLLSGWWPRLVTEKLNASNLIFALTALFMMILFIPPVQKYLTPSEQMSFDWDAPEDIGIFAYLELRQEIESLTPTQKQRFIAHVHKVTDSKKPWLNNDVIFQYATDHLHHVTFTNKGGSFGTFWINRDINLDTYEALTRSTKYILGVGYEWIKVFQAKDPKTWGGEYIHFKLLPNTQLLPERVKELMTAKFNDWNWDLRQIDEDEYEAKYRGFRCSDTRVQLSQYFNHQCTTPTESKLPKELIPHEVQ